MVDMAAVAASLQMPEKAMPAGTADLQITYLRQPLDYLARSLKSSSGRQLCTIQVAIVNPEGVTCCVGRVLYALRPIESNLKPATAALIGERWQGDVSFDTDHQKGLEPPVAT